MFYRLDAFALAMSQHYRILKEVLLESKTPKMMSVEDARAADRVAGMLENIGGKPLADLCRLRFQDAWVAWDIDKYDVREILEYILAHSRDCIFKTQLKARMATIVELVYRLSNPIHKKYTTKPRRKAQSSEQLLLFPELEPKEEEQEDKEEQEARRMSRLDRLADEIIDAEYGETEDDKEEDEDAEDEEDGDNDNDEDAEDEDDIHDRLNGGDACDRFSRGFSGMGDRDYGYFSGNYGDYDD